MPAETLTIATPPEAQLTDGFEVAVPKLEASSQQLVAAADVTHQQPSEIANKDAGCHAVTHSHAVSEISANQRQSAVKDSVVGVGIEVGQRPVASSQQVVDVSHVTHAGSAEIASKNAACHAVTHSHALSEISAD